MRKMERRDMRQETTYPTFDFMRTVLRTDILCGFEVSSCLWIKRIG